MGSLKNNNNKRIQNYLIYDALKDLIDFTKKDLKEDIDEIKENMMFCQKHRLPTLEKKVNNHIRESEFKRGNLVIGWKTLIALLGGVAGAIKLPELWNFLQELVNS